MRLLVLLAVVAAFVTAPAGAQAPTAAGDVRELAESLREFHPRPFHSVSRARFEAAVQRAATRAPSLTRNELVVELMRIAALIGDRNGHSGIFPGDPQHRTQLHLYPIRLYTFDDGTYVVDAVEPRPRRHEARLDRGRARSRRSSRASGRSCRTTTRRTSRAICPTSP